MTIPSEPQARPLTPLQMELLKLYATDLSGEELREVKRELAQHFARKAVAGADAAWKERVLSDEVMDRWLDG